MFSETDIGREMESLRFLIAMDHFQNKLHSNEYRQNNGIHFA
jgi:hypothetical protein